jgi:hypothetical protein
MDRPAYIIQESLSEPANREEYDRIKI